MRTGSVLATFGSIGSRRNLPPFTFSNGRVSDPSSTVGSGLHFRPRENRAANGDATIFVLSISLSLSLLLLLYFPPSRDSRPGSYISYCEMQIALYGNETHRYSRGLRRGPQLWERCISASPVRIHPSRTETKIRFTVKILRYIYKSIARSAKRKGITSYYYAGLVFSPGTAD